MAVVAGAWAGVGVGQRRRRRRQTCHGGDDARCTNRMSGRLSIRLRYGRQVAAVLIVVVAVVAAAWRVCSFVPNSTKETEAEPSTYGQTQVE